MPFTMFGAFCRSKSILTTAADEPRSTHLTALVLPMEIPKTTGTAGYFIIAIAPSLFCYGRSLRKNKKSLIDRNIERKCMKREDLGVSCVSDGNMD